MIALRTRESFRSFYKLEQLIEAIEGVFIVRLQHAVNQRDKLRRFWEEEHVYASIRIIA